MAVRVVIDTNVVISALLSQPGVPGRILHLFKQQVFEWIISEEIFQEYAFALRYDKVRKKHKLTDEQILQFLEDMRSATILVKPTVRLDSVVSDPDDNKFFECALEGGAQFVVSGDVAVQQVRNYQEVRVLSPAVFLTMLEQETTVP